MNFKIGYRRRLKQSQGFLGLILMIAVLGLLLNGQARVEATSPTENVASTPQGTELLYLPIISVPRAPTPFGIESNRLLLSGTQMMNRVSDLQVGWTRLNGRISWAELQPVEGGPILWEQLTGFESELRTLKTAQIKPIVIVDDYPHWATIEANSCGALQADKFDDFAAFATALVARYKSFGVYDWELGNEPDVDPDLLPRDYVFGCWGDISDLDFYGGDHYGEMVKVVGAAIKAEDPSAQVWLGGLLLDTPETTRPDRGKPERFLRGILEVGAAPYFDMVPYHSYPPYVNRRTDHDNDLGDAWQAWGGKLVGKAKYLTALMTEYGVSKPLFLNETGLMCPDHPPYSSWCESPNPDFYQAQADFIVRGFVRVVANRVEGVIWYTLNAGWRHTGLLDPAGNPLPAYNAYQVLNQQLLGASYREPVSYAEGVEAYAFQRRGEQIHVVWAMKDEVLEILVPQDKFVNAYDQYGNPLTPAAVGSNYRFEVRFDPIYITRLP